MQESTEFGWRSVCEWHRAVWGSPVQNSCVNFLFRSLTITQLLLAIAQQSRYKKGEVNEDTSNRKKTLDINPFLFLKGSAAVFSEQRWIRVCRLVEPRAPEGCCTGRLEQHKEASNSPSGKSPHRSTGNGNAICLLLSRSPLLGAGKKLAHGGGLSVPCCAEVGCRLLGGTCRDQPALLSSFSLFPVGFLIQNSSSLCLLPYDIILQSVPSRQETMDSFFLFSLAFILFLCLTLSLIFCSPFQKMCYQLREQLFK